MSATTLARPTAHGRAAGVDSWIRYTCAAVVGTGLVLVTAQWLAGRGLQDLGGWASGLTSLGRWTGLLASFLLLVQVLLMARIPVVERAYGQEGLARTHRWVGFTSFSLMLAHLALVTWGYAAGRLAAVPGTFWDLTVDYPGMLLALAGTLCLVLVVVTSVRAARSRLRHESWHLLHLYAYLGVGLALPHQLWTGQEFLSSTLATVLWWTLWAAAAGAVLMWRVGLPLVRSARHGLRVAAVVPEGPDVVSVHLTGRRLDRFPAAAGQFCTFRFLAGKGWSRAHPYSLSAAPAPNGLRITVKALGDGSAAVAALRPGTRVLVEGPYGRLTERPRTRRRIALIGAGVGVTPLRALAEGLDYAPGEAVLLQRTTGTPLFASELGELVATRGLQSLVLPGRRRSADSWIGEGAPAGDDVTLLRHWVPDIADRDVYLCGPPPWTASVVRSLHTAGVPDDRIHLEHFGW
jgi:predicted ferric reductase